MLFISDRHGTEHHSIEEINKEMERYERDHIQNINRRDK